MAGNTGCGARRPYPSCVPKPTPPSPESWDLLKWLGAHRDGLIAAVAIVTTGDYLCGYAVWTLYALQNELGMFPVVDAQYFLAGIFPTMVLALFGLFVAAVIPLWFWLSKELSAFEKNLGWLLKTIGGFLTIAGVAVNCLLPAEFGIWPMIVAAVGAMLLISENFFERGRVASFFQVYFLSIFVMLAVLVPTSLVLRYAVDWFPNLPQEIGGTAPRLVQFDLDSAQLSKESRQLWLPEGQAAEVSGVRRSRELQLIFDTSDFALVRTPAPDQRYYKIRRSAINGVFPASPRAAERK